MDGLPRVQYALLRYTTKPAASFLYFHCPLFWHEVQFSTSKPRDDGKVQFGTEMLFLLWKREEVIKLQSGGEICFTPECNTKLFLGSERRPQGEHLSFYGVLWIDYNWVNWCLIRYATVIVDVSPFCLYSKSVKLCNARYLRQIVLLCVCVCACWRYVCEICECGYRLHVVGKQSSG